MDHLYKGMLGSEDYTRAQIEKKQRRITQLMGDCDRLNRDKEEFTEVVERHKGIDLKEVKDLDELLELVQESEKVHA